MSKPRRGRHRMPSNTGRIARQAGVTGLVAASLAIAVPGNAQAASDTEWNAVIHCESGGKNIKNPNSTASGYFQIINGTWAAYGGVRDFGVTRAMDATFEQQFIVAQRILEATGSFGSSGSWGASSSCWAPILEEDRQVPNYMASLRGTPAPPPAPAPTPEPEPAPPAEPPTEEIPVTPGPVTDTNEIPRVEEPPTDEIQIVVQEGDWLSTIARDKIDGLCEEGDPIETCWEPLYEQNRDVIGPDPDVLRPGQVLRWSGPLPPVPPPAEPAQEAAPEAPVVPSTAEQPEPAPEPPSEPEVVEEQAAVAGYVHPVPGEKVTSGFMSGRVHHGVDFDGSIGDPVYNVRGGTVTYVGHDEPGFRGYGIAILVTDDDGNQYLYAHLDAAGVEEGERVETGEKIGAVGNTGQVVAGPNGDGSHLHFEIRPGGASAVNPVTWLAERGLQL